MPRGHPSSAMQRGQLNPEALGLWRGAMPVQIATQQRKTITPPLYNRASHYLPPTIRAAQL